MADAAGCDGPDETAVKCLVEPVPFSAGGPRGCAGVGLAGGLRAASWDGEGDGGQSEKEEGEVRFVVHCESKAWCVRCTGW